MSDYLDPTNVQAIAKRLITIRNQYGPTQAAFCRLVEIAPNTWNQYEKGESRISLDFALRLSAKLQISLDWIYKGDAAGLPFQIAQRLTITGS